MGEASAPLPLNDRLLEQAARVPASFFVRHEVRRREVRFDVPAVAGPGHVLLEHCGQPRPDTGVLGGPDQIDRLMKRLPDVSRVVRYEEVIDDPKAAVDIAADLCGAPVATGPVPRPGDDRGCAEPYKEFMRAAVTDG